VQNLHVALTTGGEELGREVMLHQGGGRGAVVDDDEKAGAVGGRPPMKAVGGVVEDGKDGRYSVLVAEARVVLVGEIQAVGEVEGGGGVAVADLPEDGTVGAGNFVDCGGVASGDEVVAGVVFVDRIDVEVVPGEGGVKAGAGGVAGVGGNGAVEGGDVGEGGPLEEEFVGGQVDLLEPAVDDPAEAGADTAGGEVGLFGLVDGDEGGFAIVDNVEFVLVEGGEPTL
jgi:hypothetical protein